MGRKRGRQKDFNGGLGPRDGAIQVWCDGSASPNPGPSSCGVVVVRDGQTHPARLSLGHGTNNTAELRAIELGLSLLNDTEDRCRDVDLYTDSQYAIGVVTGRYNATANRELVEVVRSIAGQFPRLRFIWIRGHVGIGHNETADRLAVRARLDRAAL